MKQGLTINELAAQLEAQSTARKDYVAPQAKLEAVVANDTVQLAGFNGDQFGILDHAHGQIADTLQIPRKYYDRMLAQEPDLLAHNINTWLQRNPAEKRMVRTLSGQVRGWLSEKYRPLDNFDVARAILPQLIKLHARVMSTTLTETRMYIKAILPELSDELPKGLEWGSGHHAVAEYAGNEPGRIVSAIVVSNSDVGAGALRIEPSVFSTWCTNLAILVAAAMRKFHIGRSQDVLDDYSIYRDETRRLDDAAFFAKVQDVAAQAFEPKLFAAAVERIRIAGGRRIDNLDLPKVVEETVKLLELPQSTNGGILTYLAQGGDLTQWGLASAVTAVANGHDDYEVATQLERAGGRIIDLAPDQWKQLAA